ncbi:MAG: 30S ribosome-binding factor RbfA [bacterium]
MSDRIIKVNELVGQKLGQLMLQELELPLGTLITITSVSVSPDLSSAKIFVSVMPTEQKKEAMKILINGRGNLQKLLGQEIVLRRTPKLIFLIDEIGEKVAELDRLLDNLQ